MATKASTGKTTAAQAQVKGASTKAAAPKASTPASSEVALKPATAPAPAAKPQAASGPKGESKSAGPDADTGNGAQRKTRQQLTMIIETDISPARCHTHFRMNLGDSETETQITALRNELKAAVAGKKQDQIKAIKQSIANLQQTLVRISSETPITAAVILDYSVKELLRHGMDQAKASEGKLMEVTHLHDGNPMGLLCFPLINKLPEWINFDPEFEEAMKKERTIENKAAKEAREKKGSEEKKGGGGRAKAEKAEEPEEDDGDEDQEHTKTTFFTYVDNALKTVKKDEEYRGMRVSNRVREYLSELVASAITRIATLARIIVQRVMSVRTMNAGHVMAVVDILMADEGRSEEQIGELKALVDEKLKLYHDHLEAEKKKKTETLAADKKAELARKNHQLDLARKKKQIEAANKRARDAAKKAAELAQETAKLEPLVAQETAEAAAKKAAASKAAAEVAAEAIAGADDIMEDIISGETSKP